MTTSTNLQLPYLEASQAQKHVTVNEALRRLDALVQLAVVSDSTAAEPGSPSDGEAYILPAGKTGTAWGSMTDLAVAYYVDGAWSQLTPREGWRAYVRDIDALKLYTGSAWAAPSIEVLAGNRTYYVRTDGNDSNGGLANSAGGAFATIQKAISVVSGLVIPSGIAVTIKLGVAGTYAGVVTVDGPWLGGGTVVLDGDTASPTSYVVTHSATTINLRNGARLSIQGIDLTSSGFSCAFPTGGSELRVSGAMRFSKRIGIGQQGRFIASANFEVAGNQDVFLEVGDNSFANTFGRTVTLVGTPAYSTAFVAVGSGGVYDARSMTFSGGATGARYAVAGNGVINTGGGGATYFPGNAGGSDATGGQYL